MRRVRATNNLFIFIQEIPLAQVLSREDEAGLSWLAGCFTYPLDDYRSCCSVLFNHDRKIMEFVFGETSIKQGKVRIKKNNRAKVSGQRASSGENEVMQGCPSQIDYCL